jgi:hypothetical protein
MANKVQQTAEYFPFYARDGRTLYVLRRDHGLVGVGFFLQVLRLLAQTPFHFYVYENEFDKARLNEFVGIPENDVRTYISEMVQTGKVDGYLWEKHSVIFIKDFMDHLASLYNRRQTPLPNRDQIIAKFESRGAPNGDHSDDVSNMSTYCDETDANCSTEEREKKIKNRVKETDAISQFQQLYERLTGRSVPSGQDAQARLLAERFDNSTLEYELARCANKVNPLQYIAKYMLTDGYTSPMGTAPHRPSERAFPDADNSDPAFRELAERDSDFPWGGEVSDEQ